MLQHNRVSNIFYAKKWLLSGWAIFKKSPITWSLMVLIFTIFYLVGMNNYIGKALAAFLTPIFAGGIYMAAYKSDNGEPIAIENLFSMLKNKQKLKQLMIIGAIGVAIVGLTYIAQNMMGSDYEMRYNTGNNTTFSKNNTTTLGSTLSSIITWGWGLASLFSIPLVAIKNQMAIESLKNSISASLINLIPLLIFYGFGILLLIVGAIPVGLGLLIVLPVLFCASYFAFKTVFLEANDQEPTSSPEATLNETASPIKTNNITPNLLTDFEGSLHSMAEQNIKADTDMTLPKGFEINYFDEYMQITRVWSSPLKIISALIGALLFNGVWITNGFFELLFSDRELLLKLFCLVFIIIGLGSIYMLIATWLNKTQIYVSKNAIEIKHIPMPWFGNKRVETSNLKQLWVKKISRGSSNGNKRYSYNVVGITSGDKQFTLISGLERHQNAHFIERKVEDYLGIENDENNAQNN